MSQEPSTQLIITEEKSELELQREAKIAAVITNLAGGMTIERACKVAGTTSRSWRRWKESGLVQDALAETFGNVMAGVRRTVADGLVQSASVLVSIAQGKIPPGTDFDGKLAPRDSVAAQQQLLRLWQVVADPEKEKEREAQDTLSRLRSSTASVMTVHINTVNVGTDQEPMPVPIGAEEIIDVSHTVTVKE
jgi:anti-sigma factor RsiW